MEDEIVVFAFSFCLLSWLIDSIACVEPLIWYRMDNFQLTTQRRIETSTPPKFNIFARKMDGLEDKPFLSGPNNFSGGYICYMSGV